MKQSDVQTIETNINPFSKVASLAVQRKDGTVGYLRVSSRGGEKDKQFGGDGAEIKEASEVTSLKDNASFAERQSFFIDKS